MARASVTLTGDWKKLTTVLAASNFDRALRGAMSVATAANAEVVYAALRDNIQRGTYSKRVPNAPMTVFIKDSATPLVDTGKLLRAFQSRSVSPYRIEVGWPKGKDATTAMIVHEGAVLPVTPAMRKMFNILADVSDGRKSPAVLTGRAAALYRRRPGGWMSLARATNFLRVPGRPFFRDVVENDAIQRVIAENFLIAASRATAGLPIRRGDMKTRA